MEDKYTGIFFEQATKRILKSTFNKEYITRVKDSKKNKIFEEIVIDSYDDILKLVSKEGLEFISITKTDSDFFNLVELVKKDVFWKSGIPAGVFRAMNDDESKELSIIVLYDTWDKGTGVETNLIIPCKKSNHKNSIYLREAKCLNDKWSIKDIGEVHYN